MKKLFKAIMVLASFSILTRALGFFFRIFLSNLIGAEGLGVYQISFSVFMVLDTIISSGLPLVVSKFTSAYNSQNNKKDEFSTVTAALIIGIITAISICLTVYLFKNIFSFLFTDDRCIKILFILLPALIFSSVYATLRGNLWGHKKYFLVSITEFVEQVIRTILTILFLAIINFTLDKVFLASISYVISCIISCILVVILYFKSGNKLANPQKSFKKVIKSSTPITMVRVVSSLLMPLISIIIPIKLVSIGFTNEQALSMFGIAMGMSFPLLYVPSTLIGALSTTLIPELSSCIYKKNYSEINSKVDFSIKFAIFISFIFIPLFFTLGSPIGLFFYNNLDAGFYLSYASFLILAICLSGVTTSCLNALNLEVKSFINYIIGAILLLICIVCFTQYLGILSLIWGMGICLGLASFLNIIMLNRHLKTNFLNFKYLVKTFLISLPSFFIAKWTFNIANTFFSLFTSLALSSILTTLFYLILGLIFNLYDLSFFEFKKKTRNKQFIECNNSNI